MPIEPSMLLHLLLWAVGLLGITGLASVWAGRWSERGSVAIGASGAVAACLAGLGAAIAALAGRADGRLSLPWSMPYGSFQLGLDPLSAFFLAPMFLLSGVAAVYAVGYFKPWSGRNPGRFWLFYNALVASMALVLTARNGVLFLVAWEAMSLASFFLVVHDDAESGARDAGWVYLAATHIGTAFLLALFLLLGRSGGSQDFSAFAGPEGLGGGLFLLGLVGFGTEAGLFPLHVWLPEAHPAAPSPVSAVMSGVMIKPGIYGIVRTLSIVGAVPGWCAWVVLGAGAASGLLGILFSLAQRDIKRMLAYSSVENIGIIALGLGLGMLGLRHGSSAVAALGFAGALLHVLNHALFKGLLFLGAGVVAHATGTRDLERLGGLLKRMPWTGAAFLAGSAAICGLPPFNGFAGEFLIYLGAFRSILSEGGLALGGVGTMLALALIGGLAVAGFTRTFGIAFLGEPRSPEAARAHEAGPSMRGPLLALAALCLAIGLGSGFLARFMDPAVAMLTGAGAEPAGTPVESAARWLFPVAAGSVLLIAAIWGLAALRRRMLAARSVRESVTWDCGYAAPAARMQYTATGYAQPLTRGAQALLRPDIERLAPRGVFPVSASFRSAPADLARKRLFGPLFAGVAEGLGRLRWLQQGRVHLYVLYIVAVLMVLLAWAIAS